MAKSFNSHRTSIVNGILSGVRVKQLTPNAMLSLPLLDCKSCPGICQTWLGVHCASVGDPLTQTPE